MQLPPSTHTHPPPPRRSAKEKANKSATATGEEIKAGPRVHLMNKWTHTRSRQQNQSGNRGVSSSSIVEPQYYVLCEPPPACSGRYKTPARLACAAEKVHSYYYASLWPLVWSAHISRCCAAFGYITAEVHSLLVMWVETAARGWISESIRGAYETFVLFVACTCSCSCGGRRRWLFYGLIWRVN